MNTEKTHSSRKGQQQGIAAKAGERVAVAHVGGQAVAIAGQRRGRPIRKPIRLGGVEQIGFENAEGQRVGGGRPHHAADARGVVGRIRLPLPRLQRRVKAATRL